MITKKTQRDKIAKVAIQNTWAFLRAYCIIYSKMGPDFFNAKVIAVVEPGLDKIAVQEVPNPQIGAIPGKNYREQAIIPLDKHIIIDSIYDPTFSLLIVWGFDEVAKILPYWQTNHVMTYLF